MVSCGRTVKRNSVRLCGRFCSAGAVYVPLKYLILTFIPCYCGMPNSPEQKKVPCKYGANCYQKNPAHHEKYSHATKRSSSPISETSSKKTKEEVYNKPETSKRMECYMTGLNIPEDFKVEISIAQLPGDMPSKVKEVFCLEMPPDFFSFYEFCLSVKKYSAANAFKDVGLKLVGPFDLLCGKIDKCTRAEALLRNRYYYDPPEFQTVLRAEGPSQLHYGYFRDDPKELPVFVASNEAAVDCNIKCVAGNIFGAVNQHLELIKKTANPFLKMKIQTLQRSLQQWSEFNQFTLNTLTPEIKKRRAQVVTKTFHGAGIVVPYDSKTEVGYRELVEDDKTLKRIMKNIVENDSDEDHSTLWAKLQPVITFANIANDECDFGTSLELGINLFCDGSDKFHKSALQLLKTSYNLLGRTLYAVIAELHISNRNKTNI